MYGLKFKPLSSETEDIVAIDPFAYYTRYSEIFEPFPRAEIPDCEYPTTGKQPFIVEAPLNSVEVLEALLKPDVPFEVFKAKTISLGPRQHAKPRQQKLYEEWAIGPGRLRTEERREISIICAPKDSLYKLQDQYGDENMGFWPIRLHYMIIPWSDGNFKSLSNPYALVLNFSPSRRHTYKGRFERLLKRNNLVGCGFSRSLLEPGTIPLPENLQDYMRGVPGHEAALPYFRNGESAGESEVAEAIS
jgi:hypothetical protein